jgi:transposase
MKVTTVGIDLAKQVFQIHGVDEHGKTTIKKQLRRAQMAEFFVNLPPCLACDIAGRHRPQASRPARKSWIAW